MARAENRSIGYGQHSAPIVARLRRSFDRSEEIIKIVPVGLNCRLPRWAKVVQHHMTEDESKFFHALDTDRELKERRGILAIVGFALRRCVRPVQRHERITMASCSSNRYVALSIDDICGKAKDSLCCGGPIKYIVSRHPQSLTSATSTAPPPARSLPILAIYRERTVLSHALITLCGTSAWARLRSIYEVTADPCRRSPTRAAMPRAAAP